MDDSSEDGDTEISIFNDDDESQTFDRDEKELPNKENDTPHTCGQAIQMHQKTHGGGRYQPKHYTEYSN